MAKLRLESLANLYPMTIWMLLLALSAPMSDLFNSISTPQPPTSEEGIQPPSPLP